MIRSQEIGGVAFVILGLLVVVFLLRVSGENWWHGFSLATAVPDARLHVSLAKPVSNYELFVELDRISDAAGFSSRRGTRSLLPDQPPELGANRWWSWQPTDRSSHRNYSVVAGWEETGEDSTGFDFIFHHRGTEPFTALEWLLFNRWKETYFPSAFPDAVITITRHPAESTDCDELANISKLTGLPAPEKYIQHCEELKAKNR